jgi:hypothetical protein
MADKIGVVKGKSLVGRKLARLTVQSEHRLNNITYCVCQCDCGKLTTVQKSSIGTNTTSCGCNKKRYSQVAYLPKQLVPHSRNS